MHTFSQGGTCRSVLLGSAIVAAFTVSGCARRNAPSDPQLARQSLTTALESWKAGDPPTKIRESLPPITMVDPAWEAGQKLESYEVVGQEVDDGVNLTCPVKLVCTDKSGKKSTAQIKYVVGTAPQITIFRHRASY
jgi:hypothetical protein